MKTVILLVLVAAAAAFYFGYEPYDLVPVFRPAPAPVRHAHQPTQDAPTPELQRNGEIVVAKAPDGSLEHRWKNLPTPSPTKP